MQYVMKILIAMLVTAVFVILCTGVKWLCKKAIYNKQKRGRT